MKCARWGLVALLMPSLLTAQVNPSSKLLDWGKVRVLLAPGDGGGTLLWARRHDPQSDSSKSVAFISYLDPDVTEQWIRETREFLVQPPSESDTSTFRTSPLLVTDDGEVFILYRRVNGTWSAERFIAFQTFEGKVDLAIWTQERSVLEFLNTLETVVREPALGAPTPDTIPRDGTVGGATRVRQRSGIGMIDYPDTERLEEVTGDVWVSYVVLPNGTADMDSYQALYVDSAGFERAVRAGLPRMRFEPSRVNGQPIAVRVFQTFSFQIQSTPR